MSSIRVRLILGMILTAFSITEAEFFNLTLMRKGILDYLDIPDRQQMQNHQQTAHETPAFMKELYRMKVKNQESDGNNIKEARDDIVRFFYPKAQRTRRTNTLNYEFNFNLSSLQTKEKITSAVLRLSKRRTKIKDKTRLCSLALFLQQPRDKRKRNKARRTAPVFVAIKIVPFSGKRLWVKFNVSKALEDHLGKHSNKIVQFRVFVVAYAAKLPPKPWISRRGKHKPNLIVYSRLKPGMRKTPSLDLTTLANLIDVPVKSRAKRGNNDEYCKRRHLYVKFVSLKIDWIVAPLGFSAYVCKGTCPEVLTSNFNPNNHAILQNLLHYRYSKNVPKASCVPTSLQALTLLYNDGSLDSFALKEFPDMIASSCGCR